jgi:hypothetical protein
MTHDRESGDPNGAGEAPLHTGAPLPPPVQEHLAQQLRATYQVMAEKPAFLGDPMLPPQFDRHINELESRERSAVREKAHNLGVEAVEAALQEVASGSCGPDPLIARRAAR